MTCWRTGRRSGEDVVLNLNGFRIDAVKGRPYLLTLACSAHSLLTRRFCATLSLDLVRFALKLVPVLETVMMT